MILSADYHTHTTYSHGKNSVSENAFSALEKGLKEVGITDHGFSHPAFGLKKRKLELLKRDCIEAQEKCDIKVLCGIESNIIGEDGTCDLKEKNYDDFDLFIAGIHKFVMYKFNTAIKLFVPNQFNSMLKINNVPKSLIKENTKTYINVIKNNPVDIISHLNFCCFADAVEVAKACADYGTYLELNSKKTHLSNQELIDICDKTEVRFVVDSDAHSKERVGEISLVENILDKISFDKSRIDNIDGRLPNFRFKRYKEGR